MQRIPGERLHMEERFRWKLKNMDLFRINGMAKPIKPFK